MINVQISSNLSLFVSFLRYFSRSVSLIRLHYSRLVFYSLQRGSKFPPSAKARPSRVKIQDNSLDERDE